MRLFEGTNIFAEWLNHEITITTRQTSFDLPDIEAKITNMSAVDRNCVFRCIAQAQSKIGNPDPAEVLRISVSDHIEKFPNNVVNPNSDILETYKERIRREWNMPVAAYCDMMRVVTPGDICMGGAIELSAFVQMFPKLHIVAYVWSPGSNTTAATGTFCAVQAYISPLQANYTARLLWLDEKTPHFDWLDTFDPFITPRHPPARAPVANKSPPLPTTKLTPGVSLGV